MTKSKEFPSSLYHYTNLSAFKKIVEEKELWLTDILYQNDSAELLFGSSVLKAAISELQGCYQFDRSESEAEEEYSSHLMWLIENYFDYFIEQLNHSSIYSVSFCEDGDLLSMWRGYGSDESGVSFGLNHETLDQFARNNGFSLEKCYYLSDKFASEEAYSNIKKRLFKIISSEVKNNSEKYVPEIDPKDNWYNFDLQIFNFRDEFMKSVATLCTLIKPGAFKEEQEWRLVAAFHEKKNKNEVCFREGKCTLVPYIKVPFKDYFSSRLEIAIVSPNVSMNSLFSKVVPGPSSLPRLKSSSIKHFLSSKNDFSEVVDHNQTLRKV